MSGHLAAARAALAELIAEHQAHIDRARAAIAALEGETPPTVRPAPTPDVMDAPVVLPKPPQREQRPAAKGGRPERDLSEVAQVARRAQREHRPMAAAVAAHFGTSQPAADQLIFKARKRGHDIPRLMAPRTPDEQFEADAEQADTQQIYKCTTCTAVFREKSKLSSHTIGSHARGPLQAELVAHGDEAAA